MALLAAGRHVERRSKLRIAAGEIDRQCIAVNLQRDGDANRIAAGLVLVEEATWDWLLGRLPPKTRAYLAAWPTI